MKIRKRMAAAALALGVGAALLPASAALAANSECTVQNFWTTCSTGNVQAHPTGHYIQITTFESYIPNPICDPSEIRFKLVDAVNGKVVYRGTGAVQITVGGLYSSYYGRLDNCARMSIRINNW